MNFFKRARVIYLLHRHAIKRDLWETVSKKLPPAAKDDCG